jgi:predicted MFS family arabinose efflux permease
MKRFPKALYYMSLANLFFFLGNSFFILLPIFLKDLGASESYIGLVNNIDKFLIIIASVTIGAIIHRWDRILLLRAGYALLVITFLLYLFVSSAGWTIAPIRILHGIGFSLAMILGTSVIFDMITPDRAAEAIGIYGMTAAISNAVSPAVGEILLRRGVSHYVLFIISAVLVAGSLVLSFMMPRRPETHRALPHASQGFSGLYRSGEYRTYAIVTLVFGGGFGIIITYLPNFIRSASGLSYSYFFVVYIAVLMIIRLAFIRIVGRADIRLLLAGALVFGAVMNVSFNLPLSMGLLTFTGIMYGISHGILYPLLNAHVVGMVAEGDRGRSNALFTATFNGGMMLFAYVFGFIIDATGTYRIAFNACACAFVIAAGLLVLRRTGTGTGPA